jgi:hypothetical protein
MHHEEHREFLPEIFGFSGEGVLEPRDARCQSAQDPAMARACQADPCVHEYGEGNHRQSHISKAPGQKQDRDIERCSDE